jgi:predicted GNAT family acetyltransferase
MTPPVHDNPTKNRYEMPLEDGGTAVALYRRSGDQLLVFHTEVPAQLGGRGLGSALVKGMLDDVRARGLKVAPRCSFVAAFFREHPEYRDVLA